jgi:hypothetical protein
VLKRLPIALLVAAMAFVAPVRAGQPVVAPSPLDGSNLLVNGAAEAGAAAARVSDPAAPPAGWATTGGFTEARYGAADFPDASDARTVSGGTQFMAGGPGDPSISTATQTVDVSAAAAQIDAGAVYADLRADIGGFGLQRDYGTVDANFRDAGGGELGRMRIGPVTVNDRGGLPIGDFEGYGHTELVPRTGLLRVPAGTRSVAVTLTSVRLEGTFGDGYFDNVSLALRRGAAAVPPSVGRDFVASAVRGTVLVKPPGSRSSRRLRGRRTLPMHTLVDARRGVVRIESAANALGALQSGEFSGGQFSVGQRASARPVTVLTLRGGNLSACAASGSASAARARGPHLAGRAKGHFRSRTHSSSATISGTTWETADTCAGTVTSVVLGKVDVHDFQRDAVVPIARGVRPDLSAHDPPPPPPCPPEGCPTQSPSPSSGRPPRRHAASSYVAGGGRRRR